MMNQPYFAECFAWQGLIIEIRYAPDWFYLDLEPDAVAYAHLKIEAVSPQRSPCL
jgi:hypothetical protein